MYENTTTEKSSQYISKAMGVTYELPAKILTYYGLPRAASKIKKI